MKTNESKPQLRLRYPKLKEILFCFICLGPAIGLYAQQWHAPYTLPMFRGTDPQFRYITNVNRSSLCLINLNQLRSAASLYAGDNGGIFPSTWSQFTNYISDPNLLYCPADPAHPPQTNWNAVNFSAISYQIVSPGISDSAPPDTPFIKCLVHGNVAFIDGSTQATLQYERGIVPGTLFGLFSKNRPLAEVFACRNNLSQIGLAASFYAGDNNDAYPTSFSQITNYLSPEGLFCPSDKTNPPALSFTNFNFDGISYLWLNSNTNPIIDQYTPLAQCRIHTNNTVYSDGGVNKLPQAGFDPNTLFCKYDALANALEKSDRIACVNNLKQIALAARIHAGDNGTTMLAASFALLTNELYSPKILFCPSDITNTPAASFSGLDFQRASYVFVKTNADENQPQDPYVRCRFHNNLAFADGSVQQLDGTNLLQYGLQPITFPIQAGPLSQTVEPGQSVTLKVLTVTNAPYRFQWRKKQPIDAMGFPYTNTTVITGATNSSYTINNAQSSNEGYYSVFVSDTNGLYQESALAYVRVDPISNIQNTYSWEALRCLGNLRQIGLAARLYSGENNDLFPTNFTMFIQYIGWPMNLYCPSDGARTPPDNWDNFSETNVSYTFNAGASLTVPDGMLASCKVHGYYVRSDGAARPSLVFPCAIAEQPQSQNVTVGANVNFSVVTSGDTNHFQWQLANTNIPNATNSNLSIVGVQAKDVGSYRVIVTNVFGSVTSSVASLTIVPLGYNHLSAHILAGGDVQLSFVGLAGSNYALERSSTLSPANWIPLITNPADVNGVLIFTNTPNPTTNNFWRIRAVP